MRMLRGFMAALLIVLVVSPIGCTGIAKEDRMLLDSMRDQILSGRENLVRINEEIVDVYAKIEAGELTITDGLALIRSLRSESGEISDKYQTILEDYYKLKKSAGENDYEWWEILGAILASIAGGAAAGMTGVRYQRGSVYSRKGTAPEK